MLLLLPLTGCHKGVVENVEAELTDVQTVVRVSFDTKEETTATVKFGAEDLTYETPPTAKGTHHEALLVGLPGLVEAHYQIVVGDETDEERTIETGFVPNNFPPITMTGEGNDLFAAASFILQGEKTDPKGGATLIDPEGRIVWYHLDSGNLNSYRTRLLRDGSGVVYNVAQISGAPTPDSALVKVPFDGSAETRIPLPLMAHDFVELEDGTLATLAYDTRPVPEECPEVWGTKTELAGNKIVEIAPDGTESTVWSSWDAYDPCTCFMDTLPPNPGPDGVADGAGWTWTNALDYDEGTESYLVSVHNFGAIASIGRASGELNWTFGTTCSDFAPEEDAVFVREHQFEWIGDRLVVFDNEGLVEVNGLNESRVLEFDFDPDAQTAELVWEYRPGVKTFVLGDVQRLENGDTMVTESVSGQIERVTPDGESIWRINLKAGGNLFGFAGHYTSPYEPESAPD